jgi:DNA-binding winged helix-turn-helix (wHTH) protein
MSSAISDWVCFGPFRLSSTARVLERDGVRIALGSRALDILVALVEHAGEIVPQRELIARAWRRLVVDSGNLRVQIASLRRVLEDGKRGVRYITNVPGQGYCFVAPIVTNPVAPAGAPTLQAVSVTVSATRSPPGNFSNGVCCVDLGSLRDPAQVMSAVASAVGISPAQRDLLPALRDFLRGTELLLVLGNCERVLGAAEALAGALSNKNKRRLPIESRIDQRAPRVDSSAEHDLRWVEENS